MAPPAHISSPKHTQHRAPHSLRPETTAGCSHRPARRTRKRRPVGRVCDVSLGPELLGSRPRCTASPSRWAAKPGLQEEGVPRPLSLPLPFFFKGGGLEMHQVMVPTPRQTRNCGHPSIRGTGCCSAGKRRSFIPVSVPSLLGTEETHWLSAGKGARVQSLWPRSAGQIPSGVGQRKRQPKGPRAGRHLGGAGPPREAGAPRGPGPPSSPRLAREFRSGARGGSDLPPFTPMDGSSFAPAIASTIPTMNHSFLSLSSSLMFVRMGGFCLLVCLFSFWSCVR